MDDNASNSAKDPDELVNWQRNNDGCAGFLSEDIMRGGREQFDPSLTKAQASKRIDELQQKTGRGKTH